jgi:hypothetical protein
VFEQYTTSDNEKSISRIIIPLFDTKQQIKGAIYLLNAQFENLQLRKDSYIKLLEAQSRHINAIISSADGIKDIYTKATQLSHAMSIINDCILIVSTPSLTIEFSNRSLSVVFRMKENEIMGKSLNELFGSRNNHLLEIYMRYIVK